MRLETSESGRTRTAEDRFGRMVGRSPAMQTVFDLLGKASASDATIMLEGETGTGKEVSAEAIHKGSPRRDKPFLVVDCGAMPPQLLESELFGHERGAFTGAVSSRQGAFEAADGGTVFLDEIGELPLDLQPKLLRVLERREVRRVGTNNHVPVDVRLIAATNRSLREQVAAHKFRSDLYYRLAVVEVKLPPLRERLADLPALVEHIVRNLGTVDEETLAAVRTAPFLGALAEHTWPGNIRELRNYLERCAALHDFAPPRGAGAGGIVGPRPRERGQHRPAAARGARGLGELVRAPLPGGAAAPARKPRQRRRPRRRRRSHLLLPPALETRPPPARTEPARDRRRRLIAGPSQAPRPSPPAIPSPPAHPAYVLRGSHVRLPDALGRPKLFPARGAQHDSKAALRAPEKSPVRPRTLIGRAPVDPHRSGFPCGGPMAGQTGPSTGQAARGRP